MFGEKLRELRVSQKMSQKDLGDILGISDRVVGYYEVNDRFPKDRDMLIKIADLFDISLDDLLDRTVSDEDDLLMKTGIYLKKLNREQRKEFLVKMLDVFAENL